MSRHLRSPYPWWRRVIDLVWPFNPWMIADNKRRGRHEKTFMGALFDLSPLDVPMLTISEIFELEDDR